MTNLFFIFWACLIFYVPLNLLVFESNLWLDLPLIFFFFIYLQLFLMDHSPPRQKLNNLDKAVLFYIAYGIVHVCVLMLLHQEMDRMLIIKMFRQVYLPFLLFFVARYIFSNGKNYSKLLYVVYFTSAIFIVDILYEEYIVNILTMSQKAIPWIDEKMYHDGRMYLSEGGHSKTAFLRVPTLYSNPHGQALLMGALIAFLLPSYFQIRKTHGKKIKNKMLALLIMGLLVALVLVGVKMSLILLAFLVVPIIVRKRLFKVRSLLILLLGIFGATYLFFPGFPEYVSIFFHKFAPGGRGYSIFQTESRWINDENPLYFLLVLLFGYIDLSGEINAIGGLGEVRGITFGFRFGWIWWGFLFLVIYSIAFFYCNRLIFKLSVAEQERKIAMGILLFILMFLGDTLHYSIMFMVVNIHWFALMMGTLSGIYAYVNFMKQTNFDYNAKLR